MKNPPKPTHIESPGPRRPDPAVQEFIDIACRLQTRDRLARYDGRLALYTVLNPLKPDAVPNVTDTQIVALRWFPLDADPMRPADTASTDTELEAAQDKMTALLAFMDTHIPDLPASTVQALSGNGTHALLRLPDYDPAEAPRLKCIGDAPSRRFSELI